MNQDLKLFQTRVTWLPAYATFQLSFNKKFARMSYRDYAKNKKNVRREVLAEYNLMPYIRDDEFQYFTTKEYKEKEGKA